MTDKTVFQANITSTFVLKALMTETPFKVMSVIVTVTIVLGTWSVRCCEGLYHADDNITGIQRKNERKGGRKERNEEGRMKG
jgi:hypothetical protein